MKLTTHKRKKIGKILAERRKKNEICPVQLSRMTAIDITRILRAEWGDETLSPTLLQEIAMHLDVHREVDEIIESDTYEKIF